MRIDERSDRNSLKSKDHRGSLDPIANAPYFFGGFIYLTKEAECAGTKGSPSRGSVCSQNPVAVVIPCHRVEATVGVSQGADGASSASRICWRWKAIHAS
jgi:hypothetical protein